MSNLENRIQKDLYTEVITTEANEDFILPDYMPEIGRILRVTASLFPEECYVGSDGVDFSGRVLYRLLYSNSEGALTEAPLEGRYRYRTPKGEKNDASAYTEEKIESVATRPTAPRKLNIRARISARPHLLFDEEIKSDSVLPAGASVETKFCHSDTLYRKILHTGILHKEDRFEETGVAPDSLTLISVENAVLPEEITAHDGYASARGKLLFTLLLQKDEESPYIRSFAIPFDEDITCADIRSEDALRIRAFAGSPTVCFEENENGCAVLLSSDMSMDLLCMKNRPFTTLDDFYVYGERHDIQRRSHEGETFITSRTGNVTVSSEIPLPEEVTTLGTLLPHFTVKEASAHILSDHMIIEGTLDALLLSFTATSREKREAPLPFRVELPIGTSALPEDTVTFSITPVGGYAQAGKNGIRLSTELCFSASVLRRFSFSVPTSCVKTADIASAPASAITLYYPTDEDTLWSVGKKYGVPIENLKKQNGIPQEEDTAFDCDASLDGYAYLFVGGL